MGGRFQSGRFQSEVPQMHEALLDGLLQYLFRVVHPEADIAKCFFELVVLRRGPKTLKDVRVFWLSAPHEQSQEMLSESGIDVLANLIWPRIHQIDRTA